MKHKLILNPNHIFLWKKIYSKNSRDVFLANYALRYLYASTKEYIFRLSFYFTEHPIDNIKDNIVILK